MRNVPGFAGYKMHIVIREIIVPLGLSLITGLLTGLGAGIVTVSPRTGILTATAVTLGTWLILFFRSLRLEEPRQPETENVRMELYQSTVNGYTEHIAESDYGLPIWLRAEIGKRIVSGCHFTYRDIAPLFHDDKWYAATVRLLMDAEILEERNPNAPTHGNKITGKGMAIFLEWAGKAPSPLQTDGWIAINR